VLAWFNPSWPVLKNAVAYFAKLRHSTLDFSALSGAKLIITGRPLRQASVTESIALPPVPGVRAMPDYRAYQLKNNRVAGPPNIVAADNDQDAIEQAKKLVDGHDVELWDGARFVIGLKSTDAK
jgi:hypothetical protein